MVCMTVGEMMEATGAALVAGDSDVSFEGLSIDSRTIPPHGAFVAFAGERVDGNRFAAKAFESGARVVVLTASATDEALCAVAKCGGALLRAADDDGEAFMLALAKAWRMRNPQWKVVGVTGSVGKTTTKEMLAAGIGACVRTHATKGNFNNLLGVPLTLFGASPEDEVLVVEMGMNNAGEIARIADAAMPQVGVITNVGTSHIGNLGSREGIARAKAEVVGGLTAANGVGPALVLSDADDFSDFIEGEFCTQAGVRCVRVGGAGSPVGPAEVALDSEGLPTFEVVVQGVGTLSGTLSLPGRAMVCDLQSALGAILALGLPCDRAVEGICRMRAAKMRMEVRQNGESPRVIDDSYNASPSSMAAALDVLCSMECAGRRVAILGEIGELGDESCRLHELVGAYAAAKPLDMLVLIGSNEADHMAQAARTMGFSEDRLERFSSADDAASALLSVFNRDDLVLVKASRAAGLDRLSEEVLNA